MSLKQLTPYTTFLFIFLSLSSVYAQSTTINYTYSSEDFVNPERGWYRYSETRSANYTLLDEAEISNYRSLHQPFSASYSIYSSLVFRYFFLEDFKTTAISEAYLADMEKDFVTARSAGVKLIPRFAYTDQVDNSCGSGFCPPYGDASKAIVLQHIAQLNPILQRNYDVILSLQMGFVGIWGENYYTDFFGDASQSPFILSSANWTDRIEVLDSLLSALPKERHVQVRYPQMKQKAVYGTNAPITSAAMTFSEAFTESDKSRIGFHNDCFLASADDFGTYNDYDNAISDTSILKPYKATDSKYVFSGGETCFVSSFSDCDAVGGRVLEDLSRFHYSYLNADYNNAVNNSWIGTCLDSVSRSLGYRLALTEATYDNSVSRGSSFSFSINLENVGFSAPINGRDVSIVLINDATEEQWEYSVDVDPRYWLRGMHSFSSSFCIPTCMQEGTYELYLKLSDPAPKLATNPLYNIRLANESIWDNSLGLNNLGHTLQVTSGTESCAFESRVKRYNYWIGPENGNWHDSSINWSIGRVPEVCDDVIIPEGMDITIPSGFTGNAQSIRVQGNGHLIVEEGANLKVAE